MKIYLVRHGDSLPGGLDDMRRLSPTGIIEIKRLANAIAPLQIKVDSVYQSVKSRAQETAEILLSVISVDSEVETREELEPMNSVEKIAEELNHGQKNVMLIGHMPFMGRLAAKLVSGDANNNIVAFTTGTMVCLEEIGRDQWVVNWVLTPEITS